jgi:hypothetical protein
VLRDGSWIFVRSYFKRQPKQERLLIGAESDVQDCDSTLILEAFGEQYPIYNKWSTDRLETIKRPINGFVSPNQLQINSTTTTTQGDGQETVEELRLAWNEGVKLSRNHGKGLPGMVECKDLSDSRRTKALKRVKEAEIEWHRRAILKLAHSTFACGGAPPTKDHPKPFRASFDWYIDNDVNCLKAYEGRYDDT